MAAALVSTGFDYYEVECFAAVNLVKEWRECCYHAMGYHDWAFDDNSINDDDHDEPAITKDTIASMAKSGGSSFRSSRYPAIHIVNLVPEVSYPPDEDEEGEGPGIVTMTVDDPWMETALQIDQNIWQMRDWIQKKKLDYISVLMSEEEASLIQSTVTSFTATTANEIESLRRMIDMADSTLNNKNNHRHHHRMGIIQILLASLQESVAQSFGKLQKQRSRSAVKIWRNPLECRLTLPTTTTTKQQHQESPNNNKGDDGNSRLDAMLGLGLSSSPSFSSKKGPDQHFLPQRPAHRLQANVWESYQVQDRNPPQRPSSLLFRKNKKREQQDSLDDAASGIMSTANKRSKPEGLRQRVFGPPKPLVGAPPKTTPTPKKVLPSSSNNNNNRTGAQSYLMDSNNNNLFYTDSNQLDRESAQLMLAVRSDLDSVQQMEERMVDIMTLLGQFASLVSAQQQEVVQIHSSTADAKANVDKGQENLVEAKERTETSPHYKATAIVVMSLLLLFFHWVRP